jgi:hypothetical protein
MYLSENGRIKNSTRQMRVHTASLDQFRGSSRFLFFHSIKPIVNSNIYPDIVSFSCHAFSLCILVISSCGTAELSDQERQLNDLLMQEQDN